MQDIAGLSAADLQALRLATQVLRQRAAIHGRPAVDAYLGDLGRAVDFALAERGIGFVVGEPPAITVDPAASGEDRRLLDDQLRLLADNPRLTDALRAVCSALREGVAA